MEALGDPIRLRALGLVGTIERDTKGAKTRFIAPAYGKFESSSLQRRVKKLCVPLKTAPPDRFVYDPDDPVPTCGGNTLIIPMGVQDQRQVETRLDVLVYTSAPVLASLEVSGPLVVKMFASSSAIDTDFTAKLVDVRPDGYAQNLADGILRTRYRASRMRPAFLRPDLVYELTIDLWTTSHVILTGHRVRLEISSSNFPRFELLDRADKVIE
jgi:putative CocE/NonD family hydrolase